MRCLIILAAATSLLAASTAAMADDIDATASRHVSIAKTDFHDPASVRALYKRLNLAARVTCDSITVGLGASMNRDSECVARTLSAAVQSVNRPLLTAEYQQHEAVRMARGY